MRMSQYSAQIWVVVRAINEQLVELHMDAASERGAPTSCVVWVAQMAFIHKWRKSLCSGQRHKSDIGTRVRRMAIVGYTMFGVTTRLRTREKESKKYTTTVRSFYIPTGYRVSYCISLRRKILKKGSG